MNTKKFEEAMADIDINELITSVESEVYGDEAEEGEQYVDDTAEESSETDDFDEDEDEESEEPEKLKIVDDKEFKKVAKKDRANKRIRELNDEKKELKRELSELREIVGKLKLQGNVPQQDSAQQSDVNEQELLNKIYSKDPKQLLEGLKELVSMQTKKLYQSNVEPKLKNVELYNRLNEDGISKSQLAEIYKEHPELKDLPDGGYDIVKKLAEKNKRSRSVSKTARPTSSVSSSRGIIKGNVNKKMAQEAFLADLMKGL